MRPIKLDVFAVLVILLAMTSCEKNQSVDLEENPIQAVDLGLSVKWATCNVGASSPQDYGDYFAWGETVSKDNYIAETYKFIAGYDCLLTKYTDSICGYEGFEDLKTVLDSEDDAAYVNWGKEWRTPTKDEFQELIDSCTWEWITLNGIRGYKVSGKKPGFENNSIFLPAQGYMYDAYPYQINYCACYWSSDLSDSSAYEASYLYFHFNGKGFDTCYRYYGQSIRPVCE